MKSIPLILTSLGLAVTGQIFLKVGMHDIGEVAFSQITSKLSKMVTSPFLITGILFYAVSAVLWMVVLSQVELSYAYPFLGLTYVVILLLGRFVFQEEIPAVRWLGSALIFIGVMISARQ